MRITRNFVLIVGVAAIAALIVLLRSERPRANNGRDDRSTPTEAAAPPANPRVGPKAVAAFGDARVEGPGPESAPLPQSSAAAPLFDAIEDLKLPPFPEILETERAFAAEPVDSNWSSSTETHILGEIAQITGLELLTLRAECKTSLCRLHVAQRELPRANPFPALVDRLGMKPRWVVTVVDRNGVPTSLAYLERGSAGSGESAVGRDIEIRRSKPE